MNISVIGPFGVGKGTQVAKLAAKYDLLAISPGEVFKLNIKDGTGLGIMAKRYVEGGELVPDEIAAAMVEASLREVPRQKGVVLDGFPRTIYQATFLDELLKELGRQLDSIVYLRASEEEVMKRLSSKVQCKVCRRSFDKNHSLFSSCPLGLCLGEHLAKTDESRPETAKLRQRVFHNATGPLLDYYSKSATLRMVNGEQSVDQVHRALLKILDGLGGHADGVR